MIVVALLLRTALYSDPVAEVVRLVSREIRGMQNSRFSFAVFSRMNVGEVS